MIIDAKTGSKILIHKIQQYIKWRMKQIKWGLSHEYYVGLTFENQSKYKGKNYIIILIAAEKKQLI